MATAQYKPLLFTTTLRNPERMKDFIKIIASYDGQILTNQLIDNIVFDLISKKLYIPVYVNRTPRLKAQLAVEDQPFSEADTREIIMNSPQKHKEAGFDWGWPSRFDTWFKFFKELGLVYYKMNERIIVSEAGNKLVLATQEGYEHLETQVFLNAFVKYQRVNPYLKVLNNNKPLILLLNVIKELKNRIGDNSAGVSINEIPLFICWKDDNFNELTDKIMSIRDQYGLNPSNEVIYGFCKEILELTEADEKRFKISNITGEMPDEFIRKMRLTGVITIRGMGRFIDINSLETEKVDYILEHYSEIQNFDNEDTYFNYMSSIDHELVSADRVITPTSEEKHSLFTRWVNEFDLDTLKDELLILTNSRTQSRNDVFKFISEPLRLEFLTALTLQKKFVDIVVDPNYSIDDEGLPTSFAAGGAPDIVCKDHQGNVLFEVTMITGAQQCIREMNAITRHLQDTRVTEPNSFSVILAPRIHEDTVRFSQFVKFRDNIDVATLDIPTFVGTLDTTDNVRSYRI